MIMKKIILLKNNVNITHLRTDVTAQSYTGHFEPTN